MKQKLFIVRCGTPGVQPEWSLNTKNGKGGFGSPRPCIHKGSGSKFHPICFNLAAARTSVGRAGLVFDFKRSRACPLFCPAAAIGHVAGGGGVTRVPPVHISAPYQHGAAGLERKKKCDSAEEGEKQTPARVTSIIGRRDGVFV